jgi:hypothetical protein
MKPRILSPDISCRDLAEEIFHTSAHLRARSFLQPQAEQHDLVLPDLRQLGDAELDLLRAILAVEARKAVLDDAFDFISTGVAGTLLIENGNDRGAQVFVRYFGNRSPSRFKRPVLGEQFVSMRAWVPSLQEGSPALQAYGAQIATLVPQADAVLQDEIEAERAFADWEIGPRKAFVDRYNGLRVALYGQLAELPHTRPELGLHRDFAHGFFLRTTRRRPPTIPVLEKDITRLRAQLERAEELLARLIEESEAEARQNDDAELAEVEDQLAALEQQRTEAAARLAELQARRNQPQP